MIKRKNRVTRLNKTQVQLSNGVSFTIVHNIAKMEGIIGSFNAALQNWLARTDDYTAESFVDYVQSKNEPDRIFLKLEDYERITNGEGENATKEEYDAENN